jgi:Leucine-rich repeat (LRR) protein
VEYPVEKLTITNVMSSIRLVDISQDTFDTMTWDSKLKSITIISKHIKYIPEDMRFPKNAIDIKLSKTRSKKLPEGLFDNCKKLESLDVSENDLLFFGNILPDTLTSLNVSFNHIDTVCITSTKLEKIDLSFNNLSKVPGCLLDLTDAQINLNFNKFNFDSGYNKIQQQVPYAPDQYNGPGPYEPDQYARYLQVANNNYNIQNNVHDTPITTRTMKMVNKLMELNLPVGTFRSIRKLYNISLFKFWNYDKFYFQLKSLIAEDYEYQYADNGADKKITYKVLIQNVIAFINTQEPETETNLLANFKIQILDGIGICHEGKFSRIINTLLGVLEIETKFELPKNVRLAEKVAKLKTEYPTDIQSVIYHFKVFIKKLELSPEETTIWLEPLYTEMTRY